MTDIEPDVDPILGTLTNLQNTIREIGNTAHEPRDQMLAIISATLVALVSELGRVRKAIEAYNGKGWSV